MKGGSLHIKRQTRKHGFVASTCAMLASMRRNTILQRATSAAWDLLIDVTYTGHYCVRLYKMVSHVCAPSTASRRHSIHRRPRPAAAEALTCVHHGTVVTAGGPPRPSATVAAHATVLTPRASATAAAAHGAVHLYACAIPTHASEHDKTG